MHVLLVCLTVILRNPKNEEKLFLGMFFSENCVDLRATAQTSKFSLWSILYMESEKNQFQVERF